MSIIAEIESKGYKFYPHKSVGYNGELIDEKYKISVRVPTGEYKLVYGYLDKPVSIGGVSVTRRQLMQELMPDMSEEEWCKYENGYSLKTKAYLDKAKKKYGILSVKNGGEDTIIKDLEKFDTEIFSIGEFYIKGNTVQAVMYTGEEYLVNTFEFTNKPTDEQLSAAIKILNVENNFRAGEVAEEFCCYSCGRLTHWTETSDNILVAINRVEARYCGC